MIINFLRLRLFIYTYSFSKFVCICTEKDFFDWNGAFFIYPLENIDKVNLKKAKLNAVLQKPKLEQTSRRKTKTTPAAVFSSFLIFLENSKWKSYLLSTKLELSFHRLKMLKTSLVNPLLIKLYYLWIDEVQWLVKDLSNQLICVGDTLTHWYLPTKNWTNELYWTFKQRTLLVLNKSQRNKRSQTASALWALKKQVIGEFCTVKSMNFWICDLLADGK